MAKHIKQWLKMSMKKKQYVYLTTEYTIEIHTSTGNSSKNEHLHYQNTLHKYKQLTKCARAQSQRSRWCVIYPDRPL